MKFFGRLSGSTFGSEALGTTAPSNTQSPFVAQTPGSKLIAYGEFVSAASANRPLVALQENIEALADILFSPALRDDQLDYEQTVSGKTFGFSALKDVPQGATNIRLGDGTYTPSVWLYHGVHKSTIDQYVKVSRAYSGNAVSAACVASPTDILQYAGGPSVFPDLAGTGNAQHRLDRAIAPIRRTVTAAYPFDSGTEARPIARWEEDGFLLPPTYTWATFLARPGCFIEVVGVDDAPENNGLFRLVNIQGSGESGDKVVLTRGGLHRVRVSDASAFVVGQLMSWPSPPDNESDAPDAAYVNHAYALYIIDNDLYLAQLSAADDFPMRDGVAARVDVNAVAYGGRQLVGNVGFPDQEEGATTNWTLPVGTRIRNTDGDFSEVLEVLPAGYPVKFTAGTSTGQAYLCSPIGFSLNPVMVFATDALLAGDYTVDCRTLTTVREQLVSQGSSAARGEFEDPAAQLHLSRNEIALLKNYLRALKSGDDVLTVNTNDWYTAPARVLGASNWRIVVENVTDVEQTAEDVFTVGAQLFLSNPRACTPAAATRAQILSIDGNKLVLGRVSVGGWSQKADRTVAPIVAHLSDNALASTFGNAGQTFYVRMITGSPALTHTAGHGHPYPGLDASYNNALSGNYFERGGGLGRFIEVLPGKPVAYLLNPAARPVATAAYYDSNTDDDGGGCTAIGVYTRAAAVMQTTVGMKTLIIPDVGVYATSFFGAIDQIATFGNTDHIVKALLGYAGGTLRLGDLNTGLGTPVALSTSPDDSDNSAAVPQALPKLLQSPGLLGALHAVDHADNDPAAARYFAAVGSGLLYAESQRSPATTFDSAVAINHTLTFSSATAATLSGGSGAVNVGDVVKVPYLTAGGTPAFQCLTVHTYAHPAISFTEHYRGSTTAVIALNAWYRLWDPLTLVVLDHYVLVNGRKYHVPAANLAVTANSTQFLVYSTVTGGAQLSLQSGFNESFAPGPYSNLVLARVTATCGIERIEGYPVQIGRLEHKTDLYVGYAANLVRNEGNETADETYGARRTHFETIGQAFAHIKLRLLATDAQNTQWTIHVQHNCTEVEDWERGIVLPLSVPADGVTIRGSAVSASEEGAVVVSWAVPTHLFNVNGKHGFAIEHASFAWTGAWDPADIRDDGVALVANTSNDSTVSTHVTGLRLDGVRTYMAPAVLQLLTLSSSQNITLRDVYALGLKTRPVYVAATVGTPLEQSGFGLDQLVIENCVFLRVENADPQTDADCGIEVSGVRNVIISGGRNSHAHACGVKLAQYKHAAVRDYDCIDCDDDDNAAQYGVSCVSDVPDALATLDNVRVAFTTANVATGFNLESAGTISSSQVVRAATGVRLAAEGARVEKSTISEPVTFGIWHNCAQTYSRSNQVLLAGTTARCLYVDAPEVTVQDNDTWANDIGTFTGSGIYLRASAGHGQPADCRVVGNRTHGLRILTAFVSTAESRTLFADNDTCRHFGDSPTLRGTCTMSLHATTFRNNVLGDTVVTGDGWVSDHDDCTSVTLSGANHKVTHLVTVGFHADDTTTGSIVKSCTFGANCVIDGAYSHVASNDTSGYNLDVTGGNSVILDNCLTATSGEGVAIGILTVSGGGNHLGGNLTEMLTAGLTDTDTFVGASVLVAEAEVEVTHPNGYAGQPDVALWSAPQFHLASRRYNVVTVTVPGADDEISRRGLLAVEFDHSIFTTHNNLLEGHWRVEIQPNFPQTYGVYLDFGGDTATTWHPPKFVGSFETWVINGHTIGIRSKIVFEAQPPGFTEHTYNWWLSCRVLLYTPLGRVGGAGSYGPTFFDSTDP